MIHITITTGDINTYAHNRRKVQDRKQMKSKIEGMFGGWWEGIRGNSLISSAPEVHLV